ncbi:MAG: DUF2786 domain-containing protein [Acidimicrobiales bacterium]
MGSQNRQRRRQKQAKRDRRDRQRRCAGQGSAGGGGGWGEESVGVTIDLLVAAAAEAVRHERPTAEGLVSELVSGPPVPGGRRLVAARLMAALGDEVAALRARGWRPAEIQRMARRVLGALACELATAAILADLSGRPAGATPGGDPGTWSVEVGAMEGGHRSPDPELPCWPADVGAAVRLLALLARMPVLPGGGSRWDRGRHSACDTPGRDARTPGDGRILEKVRALLAKAESTPFPEEAEALTAKAQELLSSHSIDRAALEGGGSGRGSAAAALRRVWIDDPYVTAKAHLLDVVAAANRCRCVLLGELGLTTVAGHEDDLDTTEVLFTSLLVQATTQMTAAGSRTDRWGRSRTRAFRQSYLVAFASRIGRRLAEVERASERAAAERHGRSLLPVLASRESAADEAIGTLFPNLRRRRLAAADHEGWIAGTAAAELASLRIDPELGMPPAREARPGRA